MLFASVLVVIVSFAPSLYFCFSFTSSSNLPAPSLHDTLSLHAALPISPRRRGVRRDHALVRQRGRDDRRRAAARRDRKSTRLNSSHTVISYAVFCLKKKKTDKQEKPHT